MRDAAPLLVVIALGTVIVGLQLLGSGEDRARNRFMLRCTDAGFTYTQCELLYQEARRP